MIYGHIPDWMREENPAFALAFGRYYSIEHGRRKAAVKGELAHWQVAEEIADRSVSAWLYSLSVRARVGRAEREGDEDYLHSLREVVRLSAKLDEKNLPWVEYMFEAYYFLRQRGGQGSPLPTKHEVKNKAALIAAFHIAGLTEQRGKDASKLHEYLWHDGRGLTDEEFQQVDQLQKHFLDDRQHHWTARLAKAGLSDLPEKKRGADREKRWKKQ